MALSDLRPTQMTVGMREVRQKRQRWKEIKRKSEFLGSHLIPVIHGHRDRYYLIDHHHLALALEQEKVERVAVTIVADLTKLDARSFRSLAGELRRIGGFAKDTTPFSEFLWADFLRRRIKRKRTVKNFAAALEEAFQLARSEESDYLPGWCGPVARE